jgi:hypothetical protein
MRAPTARPAGFVISRWFMFVYVTPVMLYLLSMISDYSRTMVRACACMRSHLG